MLKSCTCESACHECLKNYWNQRQQALLNRKEAYDLLNWTTKGEMTKTYSIEKQEELFLTIKNVMLMDDKSSSVEIRSNKLIVNHQGKWKSIIVIPAMYNENFFYSGEIDVVLSDKIIKYVLQKRKKFHRRIN